MNQAIHQRGHAPLIELPVVGTILPGMLIESAVVSTVGGVQAHSTAGGFAERMIAQEDSLQGGTVSGYYNEGTGAYTGYTVAGRNGIGPDTCRIRVEQPGNLSLFIFQAGTNYTEGTKLISAGNGKLKATTGTPVQTIAVVTSTGAIDLSASGAVDTLSQARVL